MEEHIEVITSQLNASPKTSIRTSPPKKPNQNLDGVIITN